MKDYSVFFFFNFKFLFAIFIFLNVDHKFKLAKCEEYSVLYLFKCFLSQVLGIGKLGGGAVLGRG